jgi:5'-deoxynucleotidase YfbR-like HD superfamily hydrolase
MACPPSADVPPKMPTDPAGAWIVTFTGRKFFPLAPNVEDIDIRDIARALSNTCRFNGHVKRFYSVAQHSVLVSRRVPKQYALAGLLHDASEAYIADVTKPVKDTPEMEAYRVIEDRLQRTIFRAFGLAPEMPQCVHMADQKIVANEAASLFDPIPEWIYEREPYRNEDTSLWRVEPVNPDTAQMQFLERYEFLRNQAKAA